MSFSRWWQPDQHPTSPDNKYTRYLSLLTSRKLVLTLAYLGYIGLGELRKVAKDLGELTDDTLLQEMIEKADIDHDTVISEEEFYNLLTKKVFWFKLGNDLFRLFFNPHLILFLFLKKHQYIKIKFVK